MPTHTPLITIVMPALNSEGTIGKALEAVRKQDLHAQDVEILVIDGGSTDATPRIAEQFGARVVPNPRVQQEYAKHLGLLQARGRYAMFLDSDEVLSAPDALSRRIRVLREHSDVGIVLTGGYRKPEGASAVNEYINLFSDPFAFFMQRLSSDYRYFYSSMVRAYGGEPDAEGFAKLLFREALPVVDISAGNTIDLEYFRHRFATRIEDVTVIPLVFTLIARDGKAAAILNEDYVFHYSCDTFSRYLRKLRWRVLMNVHHSQEPGVGFTNREALQPLSVRIKKLAFMPYSLTIVLPALDGLVMAISKRSPVALLHPFFSFYVGAQIVMQMGLKLLRMSPQIVKYGQ